MGANRVIDFPFDIVWVAKKCGLLEGKVRYSGSEINVRCPLPDCGDKGTHLAINTEKNNWNCPHCGSGGGLVDLYARMGKSYILDRKEATRELYRMWKDSSGVDAAEQARRDEKRRRILDKVRRQEAVAETVAPIERRDAAYRALLNYLPGLTEEHLNNLRERGLSYADIEQLRFKSLLRPENHRQLCVPQSLDTRDVSGFYTYKGRRFVNTDSQGILIPYQDLHGRIGMLELRMFGGKTRYLRFSSGTPEKGRSECAKSITAVHHVGIDLEYPPEKVYLTEGGLKADVANALSGLPFIAMAGVNNPTGFKEALEELKKIGVQKIVMAFDMDLYCNPNVKKGLARARAIIKEVGFSVSMLKWDPDYKGIDDWFWAKCKGLAEIA